VSHFYEFLDQELFTYRNNHLVLLLVFVGATS